MHAAAPTKTGVLPWAGQSKLGWWPVYSYAGQNVICMFRFIAGATLLCQAPAVGRKRTAAQRTVTVLHAQYLGRRLAKELRAVTSPDCVK